MEKQPQKLIQKVRPHGGGTTTTTTVITTQRINQKINTHITTTTTTYQQGVSEEGVQDKVEDFVKLLKTPFKNPGTNMKAAALGKLENGSGIFFNMLKNGDRTQNLEDLMRYILYKATGKSYGVTEFNFEIFKIKDFKSIRGLGGKSALSEFLASWENNAMRKYIRGDITDYRSNPYIYMCITEDKKNYIMCDDLFTGNNNRNYGFGICFYTSGSFQNTGYFLSEGIDITSSQYQSYGSSTLPVEIVDRIKETIIRDKRDEVTRTISEHGLNPQDFESYQIDALAALRYQGWYIDRFLEAYKKNGLVESIRSASTGMGWSTDRYKANWKLFSEGIYTDPEGNEIVAGGAGGTIMECAEYIHSYMEQNHYIYSLDGNLLKSTFEESQQGYPYTCCATFVSWVLRDAGYIDQTYHGAITMARELENKYGFTRIYNEKDAQPGDIMYYSYGHVQIWAGDGQIYNAGDTSSVQRSSPYTSGWGSCAYALRAPSN